MNNLTEAEYFEFQDFLSSNKDEMEYFNIKVKDNQIITFEEYIKELKKVRNELVKETKPLLSKIVERNTWIKTVEFCCDGPIIFNPEKERLSISQKENKIKTNEIFDFLGNPPIFLGMYYDVISYSIWALSKTKQLGKNSQKEIIEMFSLIKQYFQPQYLSTYSVSKKFEFQNSSDYSSVCLVGKSKEKNGLFYARLADDEIDYFSLMFIDAKIKNNCLGKEDIKTLSKKIYIAKNR